MDDISSEKVVEGYMKKAAIDIIKEHKFIPITSKHLESWLCKNSEIIVERAKKYMREFSIWLTGDSESAKEATSILCKNVYNLLKEELKDKPVKYCDRYLQYCNEHNCTPEEMKKKDKGGMANYICWKPKQPITQ